MSSDIKANYEAVLADLIARRDDLNMAIKAIQTTMGISNGTVTISTAPNPKGEQETEIRRDAFFSMSIPDAAKKFLAMSKGVKSTTEIAVALERGGMTHSAGNFTNSVGSILHRLDSSNGEIVRVGRGTWGLAEWYPGRRRGKQKQNGDEAATSAGEKSTDQDASDLM